ncbi:MAG: hypothetical protein ACRCWP_07005 [Shewanella sp.]
MTQCYGGDIMADISCRGGVPWMNCSSNGAQSPMTLKAMPSGLSLSASMLFWYFRLTS